MRNWSYVFCQIPIANMAKMCLHGSDFLFFFCCWWNPGKIAGNISESIDYRFNIINVPRHSLALLML